MKFGATILTVAYPLVVYYCASREYALAIPILLGLIVSYKSYTAMSRRWNSAKRALTVASLTFLATSGLVFSIPSSSLYYPVAVSASLFILFGASILSPPTLIERFARLRHGELPSSASLYCRKVCIVWTAFFLLNFLIALDSVNRSLAWWGLYNGCLSYVAIGTIFAIEYAVRLRVMKRMSASAAFLLVATFCPPLVCQAQAPLSLQSLREHLRAPVPFRSSFNEQRFISVLSAPLESHGEIRCIPGSGIVWQVTEPVAKTSLITPLGVTIVEDQGRTRTIVDRAHISATLLSLMSGNVEEAVEDFAIATAGTPDSWSLILTPRDSLVAEIVEKIVVSGTKRPVTLEVVHANKDRIVTTFSEPIPLSSDEVGKARSTLHEAS